MKIDYWSYKKEYITNRHHYKNIFTKVLRSKKLILGSEVRKIEKKVTKFLNCNHGVAVNSGTDALLISLMSIGIKKNDEIITTSNTAIPTISAIVSSGAKPVFVDIKSLDYLIDEDQIEKKITSNTKAIIVVHLYGQSPNMIKIKKIAKKYNLKIIEDCAQSFGSKFRGKKLGSIGDVSALSFYPTKILGAFGDGGMVITNNNNVYQKAKILRFYGSDNNYRSKIHGINSRLDELQAGFLNFKFKQIRKKIDLRRKIANFYSKNIKNKSITLPYEHKYNFHVYYNYVIRTKSRSKLIEYLKKNNIQTKVVYPYPVHKMKPYIKFSKSVLKITENLSKQILSLPIYPELSIKEQKKIVQVINNFHEKNN